MDVILLERVGKLGHMGETVKVKDGYARNFLLPRGKALRATEANKKKFEARRADLEARNHELKRRRRRGFVKARGRDGRHHSPGRRDRPALRLGVGARHRRGADRRRPPGPARPCRHSASDQDARPASGPDPSASRGRGQGDRQCRALAEQAERQAKGEDLTVREQTSMDDLGLEVGKALAEAGPGESLGRE